MSTFQSSTNFDVNEDGQVVVTVTFEKHILPLIVRLTRTQSKALADLIIAKQQEIK